MQRSPDPNGTGTLTTHSIPVASHVGGLDTNRVIRVDNLPEYRRMARSPEASGGGGVEPGGTTHSLGNADACCCF